MDDIWKPPVEAVELPRFFTPAVVRVMLAAALTGGLLGMAWGMLLGYARPTFYTLRGEVAFEAGEFGRTPAGQERWRAKLDALARMADLINDPASETFEESLHCRFDREKAVFSVEATSVNRSLTAKAVSNILEALEERTVLSHGVTRKEVEALDAAVNKVKGDSLILTDNDRIVETATELTEDELKAIADSAELSKLFVRWKEDCTKVESMKEALRPKRSEDVVAIAKVIRAPGEPVELEKPSMVPAVAARAGMVGGSTAVLALLILYLRHRLRQRGQNTVIAGAEESSRLEY